MTNVNEYKDFVKNNFPKSKLNNNETRDILYKHIYENNLITNIILKNIEINKKKSGYLDFIIIYKNQLNKLLLCLPLNEKSIAFFFVRSALENLLKHIYSFFIDIEINKVNRTSFRHIKEDLKSSIYHYEINKNIESLFNYYGKYSNSIHNKYNEFDLEFNNIENLIINGEIDLKILDDDLVDIMSNYYVIVNNIYSISYESFSSAERLRIHNNLSKNRAHKIEKIFLNNSH